MIEAQDKLAELHGVIDQIVELSNQAVRIAETIPDAEVLVCLMADSLKGNKWRVKVAGRRSRTFDECALMVWGEEMKKSHD